MSTPTLGFLGKRIDLAISKGYTFGPHSVALTNPDLSPVDLTGSTITGHLRKTPAGADIALTFDVTIVSAVGGVFKFGATSASTLALSTGKLVTDPESKYSFDMQWTDSTGRVLPLFFGDAIVDRGLSYG